MVYGAKIYSCWRAGVAAALTCLVLIGCGGGGGSEEAGPAAPGATVLQGNWRMSVLEEGIQTDTGVTAAGAQVPSAETVSQLTAADLSGALVQVPVDGYIVTVNGNTITVTGPNTNYALTVNSISASGYQSCGACGVGSEVSFQVNLNITAGGVIDGIFQPTTTASGSVVLKWVRLN